MTLNQLHILQHSLGCDKHGKSTYRGRDEGDGCGVYHRNYFQTNATSLNGVECESLVELGFMKRSTALNMNYYYVTPSGIKKMILASPKPIRSR